MSKTTAVVTMLLLAFGANEVAAQQGYFKKSYALVVGINKYREASWPELTYAEKDARGFADFLKKQGFEVIELYDEQATRAAIVAAFEDQLVPKLTADDRVAFFFAGHGQTRKVVGSDRGYLVPFDGTSASFSSLIPMTIVHDYSDAMKAARHQLFILDACFGGLAATRGVESVDPKTPAYVDAISTRLARELLTAGGADQRVSDGGESGHSKFTGQLLKALNDGVADRNGDGYATFNEISSYIQTAAANYGQTPGIAYLNGHAQGDFWFTVPGRTTVRGDSAGAATGAREPQIDVYKVLRDAKLALGSNDAESRRLFQQAADLGNAEAMSFLAKLMWEGRGGLKDQVGAEAWLLKAAERGDISAMKSLESLARLRNDLAAVARWHKQIEDVEKLLAAVNLVDPTGEAAKSQPTLPANAAVLRPSAPSNLSAQ